MSETILKTEAIHTFIGQHHILQGISFEAKADAVTVLIGRTCSGAESCSSSQPNNKAAKTKHGANRIEGIASPSLRVFRWTHFSLNSKSRR